jgi:hypothetical protein
MEDFTTEITHLEELGISQKDLAAFKYWEMNTEQTGEIL